MRGYLYDRMKRVVRAPMDWIAAIGWAVIQLRLEIVIVLSALTIAAAIESLEPTMPVRICEGCTVVEGATVTTTGGFEYGININPPRGYESVAYPAPEWARLDDTVHRYEASP